MLHFKKIHKNHIEECKTGLKEQVPEVVEIGAAEFLVGLGVMDETSPKSVSKHCCVLRRQRKL